MKRRGVEMRLIIDGDAASLARIDLPLLDATARAYRWSNDLLAGRARSIGLGVGLGVLSSLLASRLLASLLFGVAATDSRTLILAAAGVLAVGVLASYLPARRAAALDPCSMFREE